ncbi:outer membrane beta-barrel protein [Duganella sp. FT135W]|uniref:Outer membrane beta-barrel protein n=1 Tax=Duganella flavida TaxID=2692175 RepID=A0A6L8K6I9_9BURK|nr:outer membrane beta-barrel protein [Duganella flavida]MYM21504.1 outer membrane beta-barrel protein [Duganella flavida]
MNKFVCSTLIALAASSLAHAEDAYIGVGIGSFGKGRIKYFDDGVTTERYSAKRDPAVTLFAGYVLSPSWALEAGYRGIGDEQSFDLLQGYQMKTRTRMGYLAARNTWQLSEDWSLYGKVGVAQGRFNAGIEGKGAPASETVKKNGLYLGLGAAYAVSKDVSLQLELEHTDKIKQQGLSVSMDRVSLGVRVGF